MELLTERIMSSNKYDKQLLLHNSEYVHVYIFKFITIPIIWSIKWERAREGWGGGGAAHNIKPILNDFITDFQIMFKGVFWLIHWRNSVSSFSQYTQRKSFCVT